MHAHIVLRKRNESMILQKVIVHTSLKENACLSSFILMSSHDPFEEGTGPLARFVRGDLR